MVDVILGKVDTYRPEDVARKRLAPPFAILYLADALEKAGFRVLLHHSQGAPDGISQLVELVRREKPLFVGLSVMSPHVLSSRDASLAIKASCDVPLVWGGVHPTLVPDQAARLPFVDAICVGEGERTIVELAQRVRERGFRPETLAGIAGLAFRENGSVKINPPRPMMTDLDGCDPAWHLLKREDYFYPAQYFYSAKSGNKNAVLNTSRGCPYRCGYCYNQAVHKGHIRCQSADKVLAEVRLLKERYGVTGILFAEDHFFARQDRALTIVRGLGLPWSSSTTIPDVLRLGEAGLKELAATGCVELRIGVESGSPRILALMRKPLNVRQTIEAARRLADAGIMGVYMFMTGVPGETWEDTLQTLDLIDRLRAITSNIRITGPAFYTPYPCTELFDASVARGFRPPQTLEEWDHMMVSFEKNVPPYADRRMPKLTFYRILTSPAKMPKTISSIPVRILRGIAKSRWERRSFSFTPEHPLALWGIRVARKLGLKKLVHPLYHRFFMDA